jgi:hypothetical protein
LVATLFIYAGSLNQNQLAGKQEVRFGFLWYNKAIRRKEWIFYNSVR